MTNFFSSNLKTYREKRKISQNKLAEILDVNQSNIVRWENGERTPNIDAVIDISNKLNIPLDVLIGKDLSIKENIQLDEKHKLDKIVMEKSKELSDSDKEMLIGIIDSISKRS